MVDVHELESLFDTIEDFADHAIEYAADVVKERILDRTAQGLDADGKDFPAWGNYNASYSDQWKQDYVYSPSQYRKRKAGSYTTRVKNMEMSKDMLNALGLYNKDELTVDAGTGGEMPKMLGQMRHPAWKYHHNILGVNKGDEDAVAQELQVKLTSAVS